MRLKHFLFIALCLCVCPCIAHATFIAARTEFKKFYDQPNLVVIASTGRSGSTMLTDAVSRWDKVHDIAKTHLLPPDKSFKGKIIFIFSNPDEAAESALHLTFFVPSFAPNHVRHVETTDRAWLKRIGGLDNQTEKDNLLSYDVFGIHQHLKSWLYTDAEPVSNPKNAKILAIKFENLWDESTVEAIRDFLGVPEFKLPPKKSRGQWKSEKPKEIAIRNMYNYGTDEEPKYAAYDEARVLWEAAPPFQYLKITHEDKNNSAFKGTKKITDE